MPPVDQIGFAMPAPGATSHASNPISADGLRQEAKGFLVAHTARLIEVLRLVAAEDGLALGFAFRDIVLDRDMPPSSWPLADVLDLLVSDHAPRGGHVVPLVALLSDLSRRVDMLEAVEPWLGQTQSVCP